MKFTLEALARANLIRAYSADEILIGEQRVQRSCIVTADRLITDWEPQTLAELTVGQLGTLLALDPEVVLIGTGAKQQIVSPELRVHLAQQAIGLEAMALGPACRTFNVLVQEGRRVAAALFLR